ncbi:MAG: AAA family ATPase [Rhizobacter sp.]|nr:AAA family ATPase [Rhizobacter sp.]
MTSASPLPHSERLIVVVGPSGAGKDSVLAAWAALREGVRPSVHHARRSITRPPDGDTEQHEPLSAEAFAALQRAGAFFTAWQAHGLHYGIRTSELHGLARGDWVVLNSSRAHLPVLRVQAPRLSVVEITAPVAVRAQRLARRGREEADAVAARLQRETPPSDADLTLVNDSSLHEVAGALQRWWQARLRTR